MLGLPIKDAVACVLFYRWDSCVGTGRKQSSGRLKQKSAQANFLQSFAAFPVAIISSFLEKLQKAAVVLGFSFGP